MNGKLMTGNNEPTDITARPELEGSHIIFVLSELVLGGAERQALLLARYLAHEQKAKVQIWGFGEGPPGQLATLCDEYGIAWRLIPEWPWADKRSERLKRLAQFAWLLRRERVDIVLPYLILSNIVCGRVWRLAGARLCIWNQRDEGLNWRQGGERRAIRQTPCFISNSQASRAFLVETLGAPAERVRVIHNGVELALPQSDRATWRAQLEVSEDCFLACMVANLTQHKDHDTLLRAWRLVVDRLHEKGRQAVLLLAGRLENTQYELKALAYDLGLGRSSLRFLGPITDISGLLLAVDLCVFSSRSEGSPNGVLESMAAGLAVAATDIAGIREVVGEEGSEYLAPPGDWEALAEMIVKLALDDELRARMGAANRQRIEQEFSPRRMCQQAAALMVEGLQGNF